MDGVNNNLTGGGLSEKSPAGLFLVLALAGTIIAVGLATYLYKVKRDIVDTKLRASQVALCEGRKEYIRSQIHELVSDLSALADETQINLADEKRSVSELVAGLLPTVKHHANYSQVRVVDSSGWEILRVNNLKGDTWSAPPGELRQERNAQYVPGALQLAPGTVYIAHACLKHGMHSDHKRHSQFITVATSIALDKSGQNKCVIAIDYNAEKLFAAVNSAGRFTETEIALVCEAGHRLNTSDSETVSGREVDESGSSFFANTFPTEWKRISTIDTGQFATTNGLFTYASLYPRDFSMTDCLSPREVVHLDVRQDKPSIFRWTLVSRIAPPAIASEIKAATESIFWITGGLIILFCIVSFFFARIINHRQCLSRTLRDSEKLNRSVFNSAREAIVIFDSESVIRMANVATGNLFGYDMSELIGSPVTMLMPEEYAKRHNTNLKQRSREETSQVTRQVRGFEARRKDGSSFSIEASVSRFVLNGEVMFAGVMRDVTERKSAEKEIARLALFAEHSPGPLVRIDSSGKILHGNPAAKALLGIQDNVSQSLCEVAPGLDRATIESCVKTGSAISRTAELSGRRYVMLLKGLPEHGVGQLYAMDVTERKEAEEDALTFGRLLDSSLNEIYVIDIETGKFLFVNKGACENLGYPEDELLKLSPHDIAANRSDDKVDRVQSILLSGAKDLVTITANHLRKDGSTYPAEIYIHLSTFKSRSVFVAVGSDITERIEAEKQRVRIEAEFKAEESRKRGIVDSLFEHVSQKTGAAFFHELTRQLADKLDMDLALVGEFVGEHKETVRAYSLFAGGETLSSYEYKIAKTPCAEARSAGFASYFEGVPELFPEDFEAAKFGVNGYIGACLTSSDGEALGILVVTNSSPITEIEFKGSVVRMFAARAASEMERLRNECQARRLSQAISCASDIVVISDAQGHIEYVNPAFEKITGYSPSDVLGKQTRILKSGRHDAAFYEKMWEDLTTGDTWSGVIINRKKNGDFYTVEATMSAVRDEANAFINYISVQRDVTELRANERRLQQAQKMEAIGALAGGIAHDFNNMLMGITGFTQMVCDELPEDSRLAEDLQEALTASARARDLVQQILTFSRQRESERNPVMLHLIVKEALKLLKAALPSNIRVEQDVPVNCGLVMGDPTQIHQVVMNLCTNAYHAMEAEGGTLSVSLRVVQLDESGSSDISGLSAGSYLALTVADTGCGMDDLTRSRIFEPFFTTKDIGKGTGMGLATVYGIAHEYGGAITVETEVGRGSAFTVYLPHLDDVAKVETASGEAEYRGQERILIIDDDEQTLKVICKMLQKLGYTVVGKLDPLEAFETLCESPHDFDLVVTDKTMPNMSGMEFAQKTRQLDEDIPILLMTGYAESITPEVAVSLGFSALIIKPFDAKTLGKEIQSALKRDTSKEPA